MICMDAPTPKSENLIWIDLEMTGLSPARDRIIEIATIVTDYKLNIISEGPDIVIHQPDEVMGLMDGWNTSHHGRSGLTDRVKQSHVTVLEAQAETLAFLEQYLKLGVSPMCGNSICQDRRFLVNYMPDLEIFFHYRNLDVSTIKMLAKYWHPKVYSGVRKESQHRAMDDVKDSIEELRYYREHFFQLSETQSS